MKEWKDEVESGGGGKCYLLGFAIWVTCAWDDLKRKKTKNENEKR